MSAGVPVIQRCAAAFSPEPTTGPHLDCFMAIIEPDGSRMN
jgi:hypothetical protein